MVRDIEKAAPDAKAEGDGAPDADSRTLRLARCLYETMEFLDPGTDEVMWDDLTMREREFYILTIKELVLRGL